ncbi:hypothetical protein BSL78_13711 [Apostichopus japonicus]|uniref:All-trans-retinol 13,14-reductase n=1 Tax=Stichopus japonicus TaxID=307972 RepID=A0A2G8KN32_STIJA|nr:hypothetical protein BSL78_13711 [Apostichopus japonicus]
MSYIGLLVGSPSLLSVVIISLIFIVGLGLFFSGKFGSKPPSRNPFAEDCVRPPQPVVIDQHVRDKVIKQGFTSNKVPENLDAVIVGSGIGGLAMGAIMAKAGKKVLVLEQHDQSGGCCHSFIEKGFEFDVGIHYCGELGEGTLTRVLIDQLTDGQLVWEKVDEIYDVVAIGEAGKKKYYEMKCGPRQVFRDNLVRQFPDDVKAIDKFMALLKKGKGQFSRSIILKVLPKWLSQVLVSTGIIHLITRQFVEAKKSLDEVLEDLTDNKDLRTVFSYCFGDFGTHQTSVRLHAGISYESLHVGWLLSKGGASEIAFHLIPTIEKAGGKCLVRAPVTEIVLNKDGAATGQVIGKREEGLQNGYGGFSLFVGLKGTTEELNLPRRQCWSFPNNELSKSFWKYLNRSVADVLEGDVPLVFISFPSAKDSSWDQRYPGKSVCTVVTLVNWDWFQEWEEERVMHRGDGYVSVKDAIAKRCGSKFFIFTRNLRTSLPKVGEHRREPSERFYPGNYSQTLRQVEYFDSGSPLTNSYYIRADKGEMYGLDHNKERFSAEASVALHPQTAVPNLYLTGQDVLTCGFSGGLYGALFASCHTLNRNVVFDALSLKKRLKKQQKTRVINEGLSP